MGRTKMIGNRGGFDGLLERWREDPALVAEGIALDLSVTLNKRLEQLDMTRKVLADRVQVSPGRISQIMAGNINLTLLSICKVALAVGLVPSLNLSGRETMTMPAFGDIVNYYVGDAYNLPAMQGSVQISTLSSAATQVALGTLTAVPVLANEALATAGRYRPGEAA
jgi:transcriptional regulator with XRE-family HTH domain